VQAVAFSQDGQRVFAADSASNVWIWDVNTRQQLGPPRQGPGVHAVNSVAFSPDGRWFGSGGADENVQLWPAIWPEVLCNKLTVNMSHKQRRVWVSPDIPYIAVCPGLPIAPD
jgi:hypothetical protein